MNKYVYVVAYIIHKNIEPIITVFDNKESAQKMHDYLNKSGLYVWMDKCPLYNKYIIKG